MLAGLKVAHSTLFIRRGLAIQKGYAGGCCRLSFELVLCWSWYVSNVHNFCVSFFYWLVCLFSMNVPFRIANSRVWMNVGCLWISNGTLFLALALVCIGLMWNGVSAGFGEVDWWQMKLGSRRVNWHHINSFFFPFDQTEHYEFYPTWTCWLLVWQSYVWTKFELIMVCVLIC